MNIGSCKFDIDQVVYVKTERGGVTMARVCAVGIDTTKNQRNGFTFVYLLWESDRRNWAGHHIKAFEHNIGATFEEAYFDSSAMLPWDISENLKSKDFKDFFKTHDELLRVTY